ncbi:MAG: hypothetical protein WAK03_06960 [Methylocystis sp.]|jgi:hypothetical protein
MRYVLAAIFVCAVGMPAASALPTLNSNSDFVVKANPIVQVAKRGHAQPRRQTRSSGGAGGIHPLVGSGGY